MGANGKFWYISGSKGKLVFFIKFLDIYKKKNSVAVNFNQNSRYGQTMAVEPDFKKSNKKSDAQGACRRLYPTCSCGHFEMCLTSVGLFVQEL